MLKRLVLAARKIDKLDQPLCHCYQTQVNPSLALPLRLLPNQVVYGMYLSKLLYVFVNIRVSQNKQKSEFWYATNPTGFQRLDEPPEKFSAL